MTGFLGGVVTRTRATVRERRARTPAERLLTGARHPRGDLFMEALGRTDRLNVIAECKRRSPSRGVLRDPYDAAALASDYARHGAAAVSVLTEEEYFGGSLDDLGAARAAAPHMPLLRKDFVVDAWQLAESCAAGADAVLLIAAALPGAALGDLLGEALALGLAGLVEVHDERELARAVEAGADLIGVNARDLETLEVRPRRPLELAAAIPAAAVAVAESGIRDAAAIARLRSAGYDAFLVGERLVTEAEPGEALRALVSAAGSAGGGGGAP